MNKKIIKLTLLLVTLIYCMSIYTVAYGAEYENNYPQNSDLSGGAYIEAESSLGTVTVIFPYNSKDNTWGFVGSGISRVCNLTNTTLNGYVYTANGQYYTLRAPSFETIEYRTNDSWGSSSYQDLIISKILNTNIQFIDMTEEGRQTDFQSYDFTYKEKFFYSFLLVSVLGNGFMNFLYYMRIKRSI